MAKKTLAQSGNELAARYLCNRGYEILERDWECEAGTVDIIADDEGTLVLVDVKTRSGIENGFPSDNATPQKRDRLERIALVYVAEHDIDCNVRFDSMSIVAISPDRAMLRHTINSYG